MGATVLIDFSPIDRQEIKMLEFAQRFSLADLRAASNASLDTILDIIKDMTDAQLTFDPHDPQANDPHAVPGEEHIGWSLAHLIVHVTASAEEGAAYSSLLARGIPYPREPRPRYETHWQTVKTRAQVLKRLEESRRIRNGYLDTWPDQPHLDMYRELSEGFLARFGPLNASASFLFGLKHEQGHFDQFREVARQAHAAAQAAVGR
jgi:hypothetical protein